MTRARLDAITAQTVKDWAAHGLAPHSPTVARNGKPIIFSGPMVRALLDGRKTQTRRLFKPHGFRFYEHPVSGPRYEEHSKARGGLIGSGPMHPGALTSYLPYSGGDRLYVRERAHIDEAEVNYAADQPAGLDLRGLGYRPSIHMPRSASRLTLVVTDVRVERLNDISEADAIAEGVRPIVDHGVGNQHLHRIAFEQLWNSLHGDGAWTANPWVVAITFTVHRANIEALMAPHSPTVARKVADGLGLKLEAGR